MDEGEISYLSTDSPPSIYLSPPGRNELLGVAGFVWE